LRPTLVLGFIVSHEAHNYTNLSTFSRDRRCPTKILQFNYFHLHAVRRQRIGNAFSGVTRGPEGSRPPWMTPSSGWHPNEKNCVAEFTKNSGFNKVGNVKKGVGWPPSVGWHPSEISKSDSQWWAKKGRYLFAGKHIGVTPSVAAPGDTIPSDATESIHAQDFSTIEQRITELLLIQPIFPDVFFGGRQIVAPIDFEV